MASRSPSTFAPSRSDEIRGAREARAGLVRLRLREGDPAPRPARRGPARADRLPLDEPPLRPESGHSDPARPATAAHRASARFPLDAAGRSVFAATNGTPKAYRNTRRALGLVGEALDLDLSAHDFRRSLASYLIVAARADEAAVTGIMGHANIETTRRIYAADWREVEERDEIVLAQLAEAGIGQ